MPYVTGRILILIVTATIRHQSADQAKVRESLYPYQRHQIVVLLRSPVAGCRLPRVVVVVTLNHRPVI